MSFDDSEYQRYLDEFKARADAATERLSKINAHDEGVTKGVILGKIEFAQALLGDPATPRDELLKRSPADLAALATSLEERLRSRPTA